MATISLDSQEEMSMDKATSTITRATIMSSKCPFIVSRKTYNWYNYLRRNTIINFWKPHLIVYLDCPVDVCMQRIKERGIPAEVNSKVRR